MGFFSRDAKDQVYNVDPDNEDHKSSLSHELIGGAAAFEAMKAYENHERQNGKPENHARAKEILAALAGAEVDKLFETKGLDAYDREEAKRQAKHQAIENLNY